MKRRHLPAVTPTQHRATRSSRTPPSPARTSSLHRLPAPPATLTGEGRVFWKRWVLGLHQRGVLAAEDLPAFEQLCRLAAGMSALRAIFEQEGTVVTGSRGRRMIHPTYRAWRSQMPLFLSLVGEFGLSPASRCKLLARGIGRADDDEAIAPLGIDPLDILLGRRP